MVQQRLPPPRTRRRRDKRDVWLQCNIPKPPSVPPVAATSQLLEVAKNYAQSAISLRRLVYRSPRA